MPGPGKGVRRVGGCGERPGRRGGSSAGVTYAVAAGLAALGLVGFLALRSGGNEPSPAPPPTPAANAAPDPADLRRDEARLWFANTFFDDASRERPFPGGKIDDLIEEGRKRGYDRIPGFDWEGQRKRIYEGLLRREPDHPEANRAFGRVPLVDYPGFFDVFRKLTDAKALPPELRALRAAYEDRVQFAPRRSAPALEPDEFKRVAALFDEFKGLEARFSKDPTFKAIYEALERVRIDPILGQYEFVHVEIGPFVLFYGSRELKAGDPRVAKKLKERLEAFRRLVEDLIVFHRERWMKPLGLKEFEPGEIFCVWVFGDRESWEHYGRQVVTRLLPGMRGYFSRRDHWAFLYDDVNRFDLVEMAAAHELTHLLQWYYSKDPTSEFQNHSDRIDAVWFSEGWAEYVGWVKRKGDGYEFAQDSPHRMEGYRLFRKLGLPLYPLREFVKRESYGDWMKEVFDTWLRKEIRVPDEPDQLAALGEAYFSMLYSQAWLFMKFLYDGQDGKYREKTLEFTKASLRGYLDYRGERGYARAHEVFSQIFGLKSEEDWNRFQAEFDRFIEKKLYEIPPEK